MTEVDDDEDVRLNKLGKGFQTALEPDVLSISEVAGILHTLIGRRQDVEPNFQLHPMLQSTLAYADRFKVLKNKEAINEARSCLVEHNFADCEVSCILNLNPETADEARTLQPSLERFSDEELTQILDELAKYKKYE